MINLDDYSKSPVTNQSIIKIANLLNPKDLTTWEYLIDDELYFLPGVVHSNSAIFRVASSWRLKYTKFANYVNISLSAMGFTHPYCIEIKASVMEYQHVFHITREKEALLRIVVPNFPVIETVDVEEYLKKKYNKHHTDLI